MKIRIIFINFFILCVLNKGLSDSFKTANCFDFSPSWCKILLSTQKFNNTREKCRC
jgi:hypothetical protein